MLKIQIYIYEKRKSRKAATEIRKNIVTVSEITIKYYRITIRNHMRNNNYFTWNDMVFRKGAEAPEDVRGASNRWLKPTVTKKKMPD